MASPTDYINTVQSMYLSYYGRFADQAGLNYWTYMLNANGGNLDTIIQAFGTSAEANTLYPATLSTAQKVTNLYNSLFGRDPDAAGLTFYTNLIGSGQATLVDIAKRVFDGATAEDANRLANKVNASNTLTQSVGATANYSGDAAAATARALMNNITNDPASITPVQNVMGAAVTSAKTTGTAITTMTAATAAATTTSSTTTNTANTVVNGTAVADNLTTTGTTSTVMFGYAGADTFNVTKGTATIQDLAVNSDMDNIVVGAATANAYAAANFTAGVGTTVAATGTLNVFAAGKTVNLSNIAVTAGGTVSLSNVGNATAVTLTGDANGATTIRAGSGGDTMVGGSEADTLVGGAGNDTMTGGAGNDTMTGGAGNDTFNVDAGTDTITDLATGDILVVTAGATAIANNVSAFVATGSTNSAGTVTINSAAAGSTVNMDLAIGSNGYTLIGGAGVDNLTGSDFADTIVASAGNDVVAGGDGNDIFQFTHTLIEANSGTTATYAGGNGTDVLQITTATTGLVDADLRGFSTIETLTLANGLNTVVTGTNAKTAGIVTINGGTGIDAVTLHDAIATYNGNGGADVITILATEAGGLTIVNTADSTLVATAHLGLATRWEVAGEAGAGDVDQAGEWNLTGTTLTFWGAGLDTPAAVTITLTGIQAVTTNDNGIFNLDFTA